MITGCAVEVVTPFEDTQYGTREMAVCDPGGHLWSRLQASEKGARASGTPFISFYTPQEMLALAREAEFKDAEHI